MKQVMIVLDEQLYEFYRKIGEASGGLAPERVMSDALFKLAGELASAVQPKSAPPSGKMP